MNTESKVYQQRNNEFDIPSICRALFRNWWVIGICGCILGMWMYMGVSFLKEPVYVSQATLIISNNGNDSSVYTDEALEKVASQYQKILSSNTLKNTVQKELGVENLPGTITASVVSGTNLIILQGTASNPGEAYLLVKSAIKNYAKVSDYVISSFVLEVMKEPYIPTVSSNENLEKTWAIRGVLIGILGAVLAVAFFTFLRDDIKNEEQVSALLDSTLFGSLYFEKKPRRDKKTSILITNPATSFFYSENIRKIATKLDYKARKNHHKVILVTSVQENEGKSTVAANLALALVKKNRRVLLLDADLKKPALNKVFDKEITREMEFSEYLKGNVSFQEVLTRDKDTGLYYVFGTKAFRNSDALLSSEEMKDIFHITKHAVDYVIIDSAPMGISSDAEILAEYADAGVLVVRQEASRVANINDALDTLKKSKMDIYGIVLNAVRTRVFPASSEYGYAYGYYGKYSKYYKYGNKYAHVHKDKKETHENDGQTKEMPKNTADMLMSDSSDNTGEKHGK